MKECRRIADLLGAYVYGDLELEEMRRVRAHADECETCRRDIEARRNVIAMIPSEPPTLTDDERLRVMWAVKGAVRERAEPKRFRVYAFATLRAAAVAGVLVVAFAAGAFYGLQEKPPKVVVKLVPVESTPVPAPASTTNVATNAGTQEETAPGNYLVAGDPYRRPIPYESSRYGRERPENPEGQPGADGENAAGTGSPLEGIINSQDSPEAQPTTGLDPLYPELGPQQSTESTGGAAPQPK